MKRENGNPNRFHLFKSSFFLHAHWIKTLCFYNSLSLSFVYPHVLNYQAYSSCLKIGDVAIYKE